VKTRVALVIPTMDLGGAEKQLVLLAKSLPREQFEPHVCLLTRDGPRSEELRRAGVPVTVIGKRFKADPTALLRLTGWMKENRPQIVHTWLFAANSFGRAAALRAGVPVIVGSERCVDPWKSRWHFAIDRFLADRSAAITTNSDGVRRFYAARGINPSLFEVIPNGIPGRDAASISRREAFRRLGVGEDRRLILAIGRLWPQKRYRDLIWAAELLATAHVTTLVIIGDGPQKHELLRFRDSVTIPKHVAFAGGRRDVLELLPHADLFWIGSEYEGQSNAVIEAMQAEVPVIATDIPGNDELIVDGTTGVLVPLGDRAAFARESLALLDDETRRRSCGQAASVRIEHAFSVQQMVDRHVELYRRLLSEAS